MSSAWIKLEHHDLNSLCYCKCLITYAITYGTSNGLSKGNTTLFMDLLFIGLIGVIKERAKQKMNQNINDWKICPYL